LHSEDALHPASGFPIETIANDNKIEKVIERTFMKKKNSIRWVMVVVVPLLMAFVATDCKHSPTENNSATAALVLEDVSCTEAWLKLTVTNVSSPIVVLKRDTIVVDTLILTTTDTTIADTGLLPSHTYTYTAQLLNGSWASNSTTSLNATTMDTTSHNFTWTTYTIGDASGGSSCLYDVAIINDTLAYAVGNFYRNDTAFNVAKWNGKEWALMRVLYNYNGVDYYNAIRTVFAFNENDVWFGIASVIHYNGSQYISIQTPLEGAANKMWGTSSSDLFLVGNNGSIAHYNGSSWSKIESGTTTIINDVWGIVENNTTTVFCVVSDYFDIKDRKILSIKNGKTVDTVKWPMQQTLSSVWASDENYLVVGGSGLYENNKGKWKEITEPYFIGGISGVARNDFVVVGDYGLVAHYNGVGLKTYETFINNNTRFLACAYKSDMVIAVGDVGNNAIAIIGKR
jgi:hypothetical protein